MDNVIDKINFSNEIFVDIIKSKDFNDLTNKYLEGNLPRIILSGVGKNWYICEKIVKTYLSLGIQSEALDCVHALHGDLGMLMGKEEKLLIFVSKSGTTKELVKLVEIVNELRNKGIIKNLTIVGFYMNSKDKIDSKLYDYTILLPNGYKYDDIQEFDQRNIVPTLSINTMQMVLDYFGIKIYEARQTLVDNYVYNHLGGNNGAKLNSKNLISTL